VKVGTKATCERYDVADCVPNKNGGIVDGPAVSFLESAESPELNVITQERSWSDEIVSISLTVGAVCLIVIGFIVGKKTAVVVRRNTHFETLAETPGASVEMNPVYNISKASAPVHKAATSKY